MPKKARLKRKNQAKLIEKKRHTGIKPDCMCMLGILRNH